MLAVHRNCYTLVHVYSRCRKKEQVLEKADFQKVDINAITSSEAKSIGPENVGLQAMKQLGFFTLFKQLKLKKTNCGLGHLAYCRTSDSPHELLSRFVFNILC